MLIYNYDKFTRSAYILCLLRSKKTVVHWFGGLKSVRNYTAFVQMIEEASPSVGKSDLIALLSFHALCVAAMFGAFALIVAQS